MKKTTLAILLASAALVWPVAAQAWAVSMYDYVVKTGNAQIVMCGMRASNILNMKVSVLVVKASGFWYLSVARPALLSWHF